MSHSVAFVLGTRPEAIKLAPVVRVLKADGCVSPVVYATGQHTSLLSSVQDDLEIAPDVSLSVDASGGLAERLGVLVIALARAWSNRRPERVIVQGDTLSALAGALAGQLEGIPVSHVEAGLRTHDQEQPFPEELGRRVISSIATQHFAPTSENVANLRAEGIPASRIVLTGNTVVDALHWAVHRMRTEPATRSAALSSQQSPSSHPYILLTLHRRESLGAAHMSILRAVLRVAATDPRQVRIRLPLHPNPAIRSSLLPAIISSGLVDEVEPLGYFDFLRLLMRAELVVTDSGGVQEEAAHLRVPLVIARQKTERSEVLRTSFCLLGGTSEESVFQACIELMRVRRRLAAEQAITPSSVLQGPFGDGLASHRIASALYLALGVPLGPDRPALSRLVAATCAEGSTWREHASPCPRSLPVLFDGARTADQMA